MILQLTIVLYCTCVVAKMIGNNRITSLLNIKYPIIQAGMIWASGWKLASAVSNAGGLGILGAGSMKVDLMREHIQKCKKATSKPFAVNLPLVLPGVDKQVEAIIEEKVPIVFTSAGNPKTFTSHLKKHGIKVVHVVAGSKFALKAEEAGCDAVVAEGFEAGGHNGRDETTTMVLIPAVRKAVKIPVIAAGGIYDGKSMLAAMVLGADAVQIGTRFVATVEASSHDSFKNAVIRSKEGDTHLTMKKLQPVRLLKNAFYEKVITAELAGASEEEMAQLLGKGRSKVGMFDGNLDEGELEIGQCSALVNDILPAGTVVENVWSEFEQALRNPLNV